MPLILELDDAPNDQIPIQLEFPAPQSQLHQNFALMQYQNNLNLSKDNTAL